MSQPRPSSKARQIALSVDCLTLRRGKTQVLNGVSLQIAQGEIFGLLGPNGAGKSTTIAAIAGLLPIGSGQIRLFGQELGKHSDDIRKQIGILAEDGGFYDWMNAQNYLIFFARLYGCDDSAARITDLLESVRLNPLSRQRIGAYSRGMKQRLALARALIAKPRLLILDEPTNGLDPRGRREIHDILLGLAQQGTAILMCSHILDDVERLCHGFAIIMAGETLLSETREHLLANRGAGTRFELRLSEDSKLPLTALPELTHIVQDGHHVHVALAPGADAADVWAQLLHAGWPIAEITRQGTTLEDFYLAATAQAQSTGYAA